MSEIRFFYLKPASELRSRTALKKFLIRMARAEKRPINSLSVIFCSDEYLLEMNRKFLKHDFFTDIITFDLGKGSSEITGELYISIDRIRENASSLHVSTKAELHRVIFHGLLHLCGFDDKLKKDQIVIRSKEDEWLKRYLI